VIALLVLIPACATQEAEQSGDERGSKGLLPAVHDAATLQRYAALTDSGYTLLEEGKFDEAVAVFRLADAQVPEGRFAHYNEACGYARGGKTEEALTALTATVAAGFDNPDQLEGDPDLEPLRADARFAHLVRQASDNRAAGDAQLAGGMPEYAAGAPGVPAPDSIESWYQREQGTLRAHRSVWFSHQATHARLDLEARRLASLRARNEGTPGFDYGLERIRAVSNMRSPYEPWGAVSEVIQKEVDRYLGGSPSPEGRAEAEYLGGVAAYSRNRLSDAKDARWAADAAAARKRLSAVPAGTEYEGAAAAYLLTLDLIEAGVHRAPLADKVRAFTDRWMSDDHAKSVAGIFLQEDIVRGTWPIPLEAVDINGKGVSLDQYKGKVLLIDFWATWCGPCRAELPGLRAAYQEFHPQGFEVVSISLDYANRTTPDQYRAWIEKNEMPWRHVYDQKDWQGPLVRSYLVTGIPNPLLVGRDGKLVAMGEACRGEQLAGSIRKALGESTS
jgi:thiol-disulfide isomerase/thioredoxin